MGTTLLFWSALLVVAVHGALALLSQRLAAETEREHPPAGRFVAAGGVVPESGPDADAAPRALHYLDTGPREAPVIVLVHGASTSLLDFEPSLRPRLDGRYRVVAIDRPGSGWSAARADAAGDPVRQAAAVVEVLDALGIERALWVGHSWGGAVVMAALLEHAARVDAGVAIAAATHPWSEPLPRSLRLVATPGVGHLLAACWVTPLGRRVLADAVAGSFRPESPPTDLDAYLRETGAALTVRGASLRATALDVVGLPAALDALAPRYATIDRPLLLISGDGDPMIPPERHADRVAAVLPGARAVRIDGAGHIVHHTHADDVAALVAGFAEEHAR